MNLTMPLAAWLGASQEPGEAAGFGPLPADDARVLASQIAARPGSRWCITFTDPAGRAVAHGCAKTGSAPTTAPARSPSGTGRNEEDGKSGGVGKAAKTGAGRPGLRAGPGSWALTVTIWSLVAGECAHERESPGHRPSNALRHVLNIRHVSCSFPGCRRPATHCDHDHTIPYDQGGRTCECNLAPLCRRHHRAKQAGGWQLDQPEPGVLVWRLPHGPSYRVVPGAYPD